MMDLQEHLFACRKDKRKRCRGAAPVSVVLHGLLVGAIVLGGTNVRHSVAAEKPIDAFITQGAAPPPPPPPPPPKKASGGGKVTPKIEQPRPVVTPQPAFTAPVEIPKEVPKVPDIAITRSLPVPELPTVETVPAPGGGQGGDALNGVEGGVDGGVAGGIIGGEIGGVVGGEVGGVKGGELGGKLGGTPGGTGTGTEGTGSGGPEAPVAPPPPPPSGPLRVGGDVKAPTVIDRAEPKYTDAARKARVAGVVVVEAIIDRNGNVDQVKVIKGLPMGLSEEAERAVRRWKFKPGTLNGQAIDTIFNLTVTFKLE